MQAVASTLFAAASAEAFLPTAYNGLYSAGLPYAAAYGAPLAAGYAAAPAVTATYAAGAPAVTALNALPAAYAAAPTVAAAPVAAAPAIAAAPVATATYAAAAPVVAAAPAVAAAPVAYAAAPVAAAPSVASSQFQAQDEFGNVAYGYQNINSAKQESGNALGGVTGSYTYADEAGVHTVNYIADALGFRVQGDNLPVAPVHAAVAPVAPVHNAVPVVDTPEVVEAKAAFFQAYEAAKAGVAKRSADAQYYSGFNIPALAALPGTVNAPAVTRSIYAAAPAIQAPWPSTYAAAPVVAAAPAVAAPAVATVAATVAAPAVAAVAAPAVAAPVAYAAAPAVAAAPSRDAVLTTIKLNPGHATFYRVD